MTHWASGGEFTTSRRRYRGYTKGTGQAFRDRILTSEWQKIGGLVKEAPPGSVFKEANADPVPTQALLSLFLGNGMWHWTKSVYFCGQHEYTEFWGLFQGASHYRSRHPWYALKECLQDQPAVTGNLWDGPRHSGFNISAHHCQCHSFLLPLLCLSHLDTLSLNASLSNRGPIQIQGLGNVSLPWSWRTLWKKKKSLLQDNYLV